MARSSAHQPPATGPRPRFGPQTVRQARTPWIAATTDVLHRQGVEKTTIADIAQAADVPVGNVYYYFKTKDQLGPGRDRRTPQLTGRCADRDPRPRRPDPAAPAQGLWIAGWASTPARRGGPRYGCPFGTLASELDKRDDGLDREAADVIAGIGGLGRRAARRALVGR
ncbi:helix-turn-helix domain-containing protein [Yinghuangia aomiensis]